MTDPYTKAIERYIEIKAVNPGSLLFYRMGDFYYTFFADAVTAAQSLSLGRPWRAVHLDADVPMCVIPAYLFDDYRRQLIDKGYSITGYDPRETKP